MDLKDAISVDRVTTLSIGRSCVLRSSGECGLHPYRFFEDIGRGSHSTCGCKSQSQGENGCQLR